MINVVIIGTGNVASHLTDAFLKTDTIKVQQINSRKLHHLPLSEITIIAVSDDAIQDVSNRLTARNGLIAHTSGTVGIDMIPTGRKGVFYPLQSFTKGAPVDFTTVPFCLEANNTEDTQLLEVLAKSIGNKTYQITTAQRKKLHIAAVFVNNFTNHMYALGKSICDEHAVPFEILYPLIEETAKKAQSISPIASQTGPAKRDDTQTIKNHLEQLSLQQQKIYQLLTASIKKMHLLP
jgi:predicted short-subunit dehydrogenase-like oxidoreductase (DUF2520 family)